MSDPRYPIGAHDPRAPVTTEQISEAIRAIAELPDRLEVELAAVRPDELDLPYREGGWTIRQLVHHLADSHLNASIRTRLALTEDHPTIRPYDQDGWAGLADAMRGPLEPSVDLLQALHARWSFLLGTLSEADFARTLHHPELGDLSLGQLVVMYGWHGRHHVAHLARRPRAARR